MANLPQSLSVGVDGFRGGASLLSPGAVALANKDQEMQSAEQLVLDLINPDLRENALRELSKKRELFQDLAPLLWNSFGTITVLLQEIVSIYPVLSPPTLTRVQSNRVCNALALLQQKFLCVIGALVKVDDTEVIRVILSTEIIPEFLCTTEMGSELSKTVATFIVQKILQDDVGLNYICTISDRFFEVARFLGNMVSAVAEQPSSRLLKHIIRCYLRLSDNRRGCDALRRWLPNMLRDTTFSSCLCEDPTTRMWLQQLLHNVNGNRVAM